MSDITLNPGAGGQRLDTDLCGSKHRQRVNLDLKGGQISDLNGRLRVSGSHVIFHSKLSMSNKAPDLWDEALISGSGITSSTPTADKHYSDITSTANTAGHFVRQTYRRMRYTPGKLQRVGMSGVILLSGGDVACGIGPFDTDNGAFFKHDAGVLSVVTRTSDSGSPVDTVYPQTSWNIDHMDGDADDNNPSGVDLDSSKVRAFAFDFDDKTIRFGVLSGGEVCYVHQVDNANIEAIPWASSTSLPLRYEMIATSSSPASVMRVMGSSVTLEGGRETLGRTKSIHTVNHVDADASGTAYAVLGLRLNSSFPHGDLDLDEITLLSETNDDFLWQLIVGGTVAGTFTYSNVPSSAFQYAQGATANTITGASLSSLGLRHRTCQLM